MMIEQNIAAIQEKVARAAQRAGRKPEDIQIVAVTKTVGPEEASRAVQAGIRHLGENRVQMLQEKQLAMASEAETISWHLIGHLQTNKVKDVIGRICLIHSLDSLHLAEEIQRCSGRMGVITPCLLQINVSGEESKFGIPPEEVEAFLEHAASWNALRLEGLMTMAPQGAEPERLRKIFRQLYKIFLDIGRKNMHNVNMSYLSMGMSEDFEIAVEEGANLVRIGRGIFH